MTGGQGARLRDGSRRCRQRGWTLIEAVVASALFLVIGLIIATLFKSALQNAEKGKLDADAQALARGALKRMKDELGQALRIPHQNPVGSPVLRPSTAASGSYNDLLFFVPAVNLDALDPSNYNSYRLIRYYVPAATPNRLRRAVYAVSANTFLGTPLNYAANEGAPGGAPTSPTLYSPMATPAIAAGQGTHWFVNTANIPAAVFGATTAPYEEDIVTLAGARDVMAFTVTHAAVATPANDSFQANYDRLTFRIEVQVIRYLSIDSRNAARTTGAVRIFSETVKLPDQAL